MWHSSTLQGLDVALIDLQHAIDKLPDGSKKRQLQKRFQRLQQVRFDLSNPTGYRERDYTPIWIAALILSLVVILYLALIRPAMQKLAAKD